MNGMALEVEDINSYYDKSHVLHDVSLTLEEDSLVTLIGRNGAGKSTTLKSIMGLVDVRSGSIRYRGEEITDNQPHEIAQQGIAYIPEERRVFPQLSVEENLRMGHIGHDTSGDEISEDVFDYFPRLEERIDQKAGQMSGGEQQMLAIGRALVSDPDVLLVDEPTEGLMPSLVDLIGKALERINNDGVSIILVEQNVDLALSISDHGYVIDEGQIMVSAPAAELREDDEIKKRYLTV
ncbi:ABC transporter ATP-binding protein [Natronorubrum sp. FCH18a]|uniref:ABC transporter ATP-binding protein n=1 Tax=Natronorubrum sp. FCH18a TaxID=3447018 RepID=UPI003F5131BD